MAITKLSQIAKGLSEVKANLDSLQESLGRFKVYKALQVCGFDDWLNHHASKLEIKPEREYSFFDLLELVSILSAESKHTDSFVVALVVSELSLKCPISRQYPSLEYAVSNLLYSTFKSTNLEISLQNLFKNNVSQFIPNAKLVEVKFVAGHFPDAFVEVDGQIRPVEIKRYKITNTAVRQALRYKNTYKTNKVYVLAPVCDARLPESVEFFKLSIPGPSVTRSQALERLKSLY